VQESDERLVLKADDWHCPAFELRLPQHDLNLVEISIKLIRVPDRAVGDLKLKMSENGWPWHVQGHLARQVVAGTRRATAPIRISLP